MPLGRHVATRVIRTLVEGLVSNSGSGVLPRAQFALQSRPLLSSDGQELHRIANALCLFLRLELRDLFVNDFLHLGKLNVVGTLVPPLLGAITKGLVAALFVDDRVPVPTGDHRAKTGVIADGIKYRWVKERSPVLRARGERVFIDETAFTFTVIKLDVRYRAPSLEDPSLTSSSSKLGLLDGFVTPRPDVAKDEATQLEEDGHCLSKHLENQVVSKLGRARIHGPLFDDVNVVGSHEVQAGSEEKRQRQANGRSPEGTLVLLIELLKVALKSPIHGYSDN